MLFLVICLYVFAYHYERNGSPWDLGDTICRVTWAVAFAAGYICLTIPTTKWLLAALFGMCAFVEILIPHAFAQRMGNRTDSWTGLAWYLWWPAYWLKPILDETSTLEQDFIGMTCVGFIRGLIVFLPSYLFGWTHCAILPISITTLWQPLSYLAGYQTPWTLWTNPAKSSQWGEFYVPIGWAVALWVSVCSV